MRPRQKCVKCGNPCEPDVVSYRTARGMAVLCKKCHSEDLERTHSEQRSKAELVKRLEFSKLRCAVCGRPLQWKDGYLKKSKAHWPTTCSPVCHGIYSKRKYVVSAEDVEGRLASAIRKLGDAASYDGILKEAHATWKTLHKHSISLAELKKKVLGIEASRVCVHAAKKTLPEIAEEELFRKYSSEARSLKEFVHGTMKDSALSTTEKSARIADAVNALVSKNQQFTGVTAVMRLLGISHEKLRSEYCVDVAGINEGLGYVDKRQSWFEGVAYKLLCSRLGRNAVSREHEFIDCVSLKQYPLRFDFYIPEAKVLIEVDGSQHSDKTNMYYKDATIVNDAIKNAYADKNGMRMIRIPTSPAGTFEARFNSILDILKPVELLEPQPGDPEGDQQPSSCEGEGSETIERGGDANQVE